MTLSSGSGLLVLSLCGPCIVINLFEVSDSSLFWFICILSLWDYQVDPLLKSRWRFLKFSAIYRQWGPISCKGYVLLHSAAPLIASVFFPVCQKFYFYTEGSLSDLGSDLLWRVWSVMMGLHFWLCDWWLVNQWDVASDAGRANHNNSAV